MSETKSKSLNFVVGRAGQVKRVSAETDSIARTKIEKLVTISTYRYCIVAEAPINIGFTLAVLISIFVYVSI